MTIRWLNRASQELIGDREGEPFTDLLDAGSVPVANQAYAEKLVGSIPSAEYEVTLRTRDGSLVRAEISSGAIRGERAPRPIEVSGHVASSRVFENTTLAIAVIGAAQASVEVGQCAAISSWVTRPMMCVPP
jgi:hypothetical protein